MAEFKGYLFKVAGEPLDKYIAIESYDSTDNQRGEQSAYRNANWDLRRKTAPHYKTKVEFNTIDGLTVKQWEKISNLFDKATIDAKERKIQVEYWNNEYIRYETMICYRPDVKFSVKKTRPTLIYKPLRLAFIEY